MNAVLLTGRLTRDPEIRETAKGKVATFSIAIRRSNKTNNNVSSCDFPRIVCFNKGADFAEKWFKQGTKVEVQGSIHTGSYVKNGTKVYTVDIWAYSVEFAESRNSVQEAFAGEAGNLSASDFVPTAEDWTDTPFE